MIEADAGMFAVPSKVPSYMCAGQAHIACRAQRESGGAYCREGLCGDCCRAVGRGRLLAAARRLRDDPRLRVELGANGRAYAERTFDMGEITDKFESVLMGRPGGPHQENRATQLNADFIVPAAERKAGTDDGAVRYQKSNAI